MRPAASAHTLRATIAQRLVADWFRPQLTPLTALLLPASWLFAALAALRRTLYRRRWLRAERLPVPVVVVGNVLVGGTGKTPLAIWLVERLRERGRNPGVILRGYRGAGAERVLEAGAGAWPDAVGDEALLIARRTGAPVFVGPDRAAAGKALLAAHPAVDLIVADDGLQHYRLARDCEIAVVDRRGFGNRRLLPAGPLREPPARLASVLAVVDNGGGGGAGSETARPVFAMRLVGERFVGLHDPQRTIGAAELAGRKLYAIAGTGSPQRFFATLAGLGLTDFLARAFPDHHAYRPDDLAFAADGTLLMTEKDAVKCAALAHPDAWVLPVTADLGADGERLLALVMERIDGRPTA
jgi:tetraacyldisaccharide 4'-kinase